MNFPAEMIFQVSIRGLGTSWWLKKRRQLLVNAHENQNNLRNKLQIYVPNIFLDFNLSTPQFLTNIKRKLDLSRVVLSYSLSDKTGVPHNL
jgi:hypothetical protein